MSHEPREVLDAVRRLEQGLEEIRTRTGAPNVVPGVEINVSEQRQLVEDLEIVIELVGNSWRATRDEVAVLAAELAELRKVADEARAALTDVKFELHLVRDGAAPDAAA